MNGGAGLALGRPRQGGGRAGYEPAGASPVRGPAVDHSPLQVRERVAWLGEKGEFNRRLLCRGGGT